MKKKRRRESDEERGMAKGVKREREAGKRKTAVIERKARKGKLCVVPGQAAALAHTQSRQERKRSDCDAAMVHTAPND